MTQTGNTEWTEETKVGEGYPYEEPTIPYDSDDYSYDVYEEDTVWTEELPN